MWTRLAGRLQAIPNGHSEVEGQLDVVEYSHITVPESVHMGDPAGGYV